MQNTIINRNKPTKKHNNKEVNALNLTELYNITDSNNIAVYHYPLHPLKSMSIPGNIAIDADQLESSTDEKECLAHELGHCMKYAFYTGISPYELRSQKEYRANKWAIEKLIPYHLLVRAIKKGIATSWELAEYFDVSDSFMEQALDFYSSKLITLKLKTKKY